MEGSFCVRFCSCVVALQAVCMFFDACGPPGLFAELDEQRRNKHSPHPPPLAVRGARGTISPIVNLDKDVIVIVTNTQQWQSELHLLLPSILVCDV